MNPQFKQFLRVHYDTTEHAQKSIKNNVTTVLKLQCMKESVKKVQWFSEKKRNFISKGMGERLTFNVLLFYRPEHHWFISGFLCKWNFKKCFNGSLFIFNSQMITNVLFWELLNLNAPWGQLNLCISWHYSFQMPVKVTFQSMMNQSREKLSGAPSLVISTGSFRLSQNNTQLWGLAWLSQ